MGNPTMGSQGEGDNNGKQSQSQSLAQQNSTYSLTLDEVQNQLGDPGKPLSSMNLDELLQNVWTVEANQSLAFNIEGTPLVNQTGLHPQGSMSLTVDEVWRGIEQSKSNEEKKSRERQVTLGERTLEDFLVEAGVIAGVSPDKKIAGSVMEVVPNMGHQFPQQGQLMQYPQPQYQHPQQAMMGIYMPGQPIAPIIYAGFGAVMDNPSSENQMALPSPLTRAVSDTRRPGRQRRRPRAMTEKILEERQKRMMKNRESAARSRARKQAYTNDLVSKVVLLEEENEGLRKIKEVEKMLLPCPPPPPEPKYQLRRTSSAPI